MDTHEVEERSTARIGVSEARRTLWNLSQEIDGAKSNVAGASTLSVPDGDGWLHLWVRDVSGGASFGYRYALLYTRSDRMEYRGYDEPTVAVKTNRNGFFKRTAFEQAIRDVIDR